MGLSSSQGRLLMLTSRLSDVELQETLLSQRQNQLAMDSIQAADKYNEAMNNTRLVLKMPNESSKTGTTDAKLTYQNMVEMDYLLVDAKNQLYLTRTPETGENAKTYNLQRDDEGNWILPEGETADTISIDDATGVATRMKWNVPTKADGSSRVVIEGNTAIITDSDGSGTISYNIVNGDNLLKNSATLQNAILNANLFVLDVGREEPLKVGLDDLESDTSVYYELDTSDDAQAESEYETTLARVSRQDNMLEMEIKQLETQHEAVLKEIDSVKNVISNNVDRTFKLFSNG